MHCLGGRVILNCSMGSSLSYVSWLVITSRRGRSILLLSSSTHILPCFPIVSTHEGWKSCRLLMVNCWCRKLSIRVGCMARYLGLRIMVIEVIILIVFEIHVSLWYACSASSVESNLLLLLLLLNIRALTFQKNIRTFTVSIFLPLNFLISV